MIKSFAIHIPDADMPELPLYLYRRLRGVIGLILNSDILTGDFKYVWHFVRYFKNKLYERHIDENYINCVFCSNLVRTGCHRHCLKCGVGTYIRCSPSLPGILYNEPTEKEDSDNLRTPWYFKETCSHFKRLPSKKYFKNLHSALSQAGIYDFEVLEGLENGLAAGSKPCHVCAAADYELYKRCSAQEGFEADVPCNRVNAELKSFYISKDASRNKDANKKVS